MSHVRSLVDATLTGRALAPSELVALKAHLRTCEGCRAYYDDGAAVLRAARGGPDAVAPGELGRALTAALPARQPAPTRWWPWALVGAAAVTAAVFLVLTLTRQPVGRVLVAGHGFTVDGEEASKDVVVRSGARLATEREDAAVLLEGSHGRRGLLLRPQTKLRVDSADGVQLDDGRVRVHVRQTTAPMRVTTAGASADIDSGIFVVERQAEGTLIAVHQGTVRVKGQREVQLEAGQETTVTPDGDVAPVRAAGPRSLVEDRGTGSVWDTILRFLRSLLDAIARALGA